MPPTRPNTAAPANDPRGQPIAARTRDWANDVGYDVGAPGPDRAAADRRLRRRDRAALQIDALRRSLPRPAAAPALDPDFDGPIVLKRGLKGGRDKKTALVDIDCRTFVVKGGSEFAADHVAASEFIGRLGLPGVRAPAAKLLSDDQKAKLIAALSTGDGHAQQLAASLGIQGVEGRNGGQISEVVEGVQLAAIFPAKHHAEGEEMALKLLKEVRTSIRTPRGRSRSASSRPTAHASQTSRSTRRRSGSSPTHRTTQPAGRPSPGCATTSCAHRPRRSPTCWTTSVSATPGRLTDA